MSKKLLINSPFVKLADGSVSLPSLSFGLDQDSGLYRIGDNILGLATNGVERVRFGSAGVIFINDTSDANVTIGITINHGANDNSLLTFKSSDVAHGFTTLIETDTYADFGKYTGAQGGLQMRGWSATTVGMAIYGAHVTDVTTKAITSEAAILLAGQLKSGTTTADLGANANILAVQNRATTRFILDADGDSHQDVGTAWTTFDIFDDALLLRDLSRAVARREDSLRGQFNRFLKYNRDALSRAGLVTFNKDGHHFVNMSRLSMLLVGATWQLRQDILGLANVLSSRQQTRLPSDLRERLGIPG
mgnify:CR=1 FL=1